MLTIPLPLSTATISFPLALSDMRVCAFLIFCVHPKKKMKTKKQQSPARILRPNKLCYFCASFFFWTWDVAFGVNELFKVKLERIVKVKIKRTSAEATCKKIREQELLFHCVCVCVFASVRLQWCVCVLGSVWLGLNQQEQCPHACERFQMHS